MALYLHLIIRVVHFDKVLAPSEVIHKIIWYIVRDKLILAALSQVPREMGLGVLMMSTVTLTAIVSVRGDIAGFVV